MHEVTPQPAAPVQNRVLNQAGDWAGLGLRGLRLVALRLTELRILGGVEELGQLTRGFWSPRSS